MANVWYGRGFELASPPWWTTFTVQANAQSLILTDAAKQQWFVGSFTYDGAQKVAGTATGVWLDRSYGADPYWTVSDAAYDAAKLQSLVLGGTPQAFYAYVLGGNDRVGIQGDNPSAWGLGGNDTMSGGHRRASTMDGGAGTDTYELGVAKPATLNLATGKVSGSGLPGVTLVSIENLRGGSGNDTLVGGAGTNVLDGAGGFDVVKARAASLAFVVDLGQGTANDGSGNDRLVSVEGALGGSAADRLTGNAAANLLEGMAGADTLTGGGGNDSFGVDQAGDRIVEASGGGIDTVLSSIDWTLGATLENLTLRGSTATRGYGNASANTLLGNDRANDLRGAAGADKLSGGAGGDTLDGGTGSDTMTGGLGSDTFRVDAAGDKVVEGSSAATDVDTVLATASIALAYGDNIEVIRLVGTAAINASASPSDGQSQRFLGNAAANVLDGGGGWDTLLGGAGDDRYVVDSDGDLCIERAGEGIDTLVVRSNYSGSPAVQLPDQIENLVLAQPGTGIGNALANRLTGSAYADLLDGRAGADTMAGGAGDDRYRVDASADRIVEGSGGGHDTVQVRADHVMDAYVEEASIDTGWAGASRGYAVTGNAQANRITANEFGCRLEGAGGIDTLVGGLGNDTFVVSGDGDVLVDDTGSSADLVISSADWVLAAGFEHLALSGGGNLGGTGNGASNRITGNAGANLLSGGDGNDTLDGGAGADTLVGGNGSDLFIVDRADDVILGGDASDAVQSAVSYTLTGEVRSLFLLGSGDLDGTGNAAANFIAGNAGTNRLDGGAGADTLRGGDGDDIYIVDDTRDDISELNAGGNDTAFVSAASYTVTTAGIETVVIASADAVDVVLYSGGSLVVDGAGSNRIQGSAGTDGVSFALATAGVTVDLRTGVAQGFGNDRLNAVENLVGSSFDDTLRGDGGANALTGGSGSDLFMLDGGAADTVLDFVAGTDVVGLFQPSLAIGNGDAVVDGAERLAAPGGFSAASELVATSELLADARDAGAVAAAFGSAASAFAAGHSALFVVSDGGSTVLWRFTAAAADAEVGADELTLIAVLDGAPLPALADFVFLA